MLGQIDPLLVSIQFAKNEHFEKLKYTKHLQNLKM